MAASTALFEEIKPSVRELAEWRPALEQSVAELRLDLGGVRRDLDLVIRNPALSIKPTDLPPLIPRSGGAAQATSGDNDHRPGGRCDTTSTRGMGSRVLTTLVPPPVTGTSLPVDPRSRSLVHSLESPTPFPGHRACVIHRARVAHIVSVPRLFPAPNWISLRFGENAPAVGRGTASLTFVSSTLIRSCGSILRPCTLRERL